jgi:hypothetical protein
MNPVKNPSKIHHSDGIVDINQSTIELMCAIYLSDPCYRGESDNYRGKTTRSEKQK